jgi:hypothetical protein
MIPVAMAIEDYRSFRIPLLSKTLLSKFDYRHHRKRPCVSIKKIESLSATDPTDRS